MSNKVGFTGKPITKETDTTPQKTREIMDWAYWLSEVHFDNRQYNFVKWNEADLPKFRNDLRFRIEATLGRGVNAPSS